MLRGPSWDRSALASHSFTYKWFSCARPMLQGSQGGMLSLSSAQHLPGGEFLWQIWPYISATDCWFSAVALSVTCLSLAPDSSETFLEWRRRIPCLHVCLCSRGWSWRLCLINSSFPKLALVKVSHCWNSAFLKSSLWSHCYSSTPHCSIMDFLQLSQSYGSLCLISKTSLWNIGGVIGRRWLIVSTFLSGELTVDIVQSPHPILPTSSCATQVNWKHETSSGVSLCEPRPSCQPLHSS